VSDEKPKESVFGIMDDLLSHLNRTKKLFMALVISSFAIAPLAIVLSILVFTPPLLAGVGQPQDVVFTKPAMVGKVGVPQEGSPSTVIVRIVPGEEMQAVNITGIKEINSGAFMVDRSQISVEYVPEGASTQVFESKQMPPRFMYVGSAPAATPFDVTWVIVTVIAASAAMAGVWLFIGAKEYRFFSHWNQRYSNFKKMQEKVDRELDGSSGLPDNA
jgi:hypothetical protein